MNLAALTTEQLESIGWPKGIDADTAQWLVRQVRDAMLHYVGKGATTSDIYNYVRLDLAATPLWRDAPLLDWRFEAVERALRHIGAEKKWVLFQ